MRDGSVACYTKLVAVDTNTGCWNIVFHFLTWDVSFAHAVAHLAPPRRYVQLQECCGREQRYLPEDKKKHSYTTQEALQTPTLLWYLPTFTKPARKRC